MGKEKHSFSASALPQYSTSLLSFLVIKCGSVFYTGSHAVTYNLTPFRLYFLGVSIQPKGLGLNPTELPPPLCRHQAQVQVVNLCS